MDVNEFRQAAKQMVDYVADYLESIRDRRPLADVQPGYLRHLVPDEAPQQPDTWNDVFGDIERVIMPGVTHWHSPRFFAYFPTANSYPGIVADILSDAIGCIGFSWVASPACTELEVVMMDWLAKMLDLPQHFLSTAEGGKGGGVIHGTASEATFVALLAAREDALTKMTSQDASQSKADVLGKLVAYCSDQAHSSVERACLLGPVRYHKVESDDRNRMTGDALRQAIEEDKAKGLIPFLCVATLGTTPSCAFDHLTEIGPVCKEHDIWLHIDAAYAGSSFICPEFRHLLNGVELANSFNFNPHKWLQVNFDCSAMWFKDSSKVVGAFNVDPLYLKHANQNVVPDYRHWQIPLGRRFRSLKLWFVLRLYGVTGLQAIIRKDVGLAKQLEEMVKSDSRFEIYGDVILGLVCFRLKGSNELNETLHAAINKDGRIHLVPSKSKGTYYLRLAICASRTNFTDVTFAWKAICDVADGVIRSTPSANGAHA